MRAKQWILIIAAVLSLSFVPWLILALRNDDSSLSVGVRYVKDRMCWSANSSTVCAIKKMSKYEKTGRYDDAIKIGLAEAGKYPDSFTSGFIYEDISALYLKKARMDGGRAEEHVKQAVFYRDKALPFFSDSPYSLYTPETISEAAGDLSPIQRCTQYENAIKILDRMNLLAGKERDRLGRQFKPDLDEKKKLESLSEWIDAGRKRVNAKLSSSGCKEDDRSSR
jgi:hypothetical protein